MLKHHINISTKKTKNCSKIMRFIFLGHFRPISQTCIVLLVLKYVSNLVPMSRSSFTLIFCLTNQIIQISEQTEKNCMLLFRKYTWFAIYTKLANSPGYTECVITIDAINCVFLLVTIKLNVIARWISFKYPHIAFTHVYILSHLFVYISLIFGV